MADKMQMTTAASKSLYLKRIGKSLLMTFTENVSTGFIIALSLIDVDVFM